MGEKAQIKDELRAVLVRSLSLAIEPSQVPDQGLVNALGLNSINTIEYLIWVETEFGIEIADEDLSLDLIDDLDRLAVYVIEAGGQLPSQSTQPAREVPEEAER